MLIDGGARTVFEGGAAREIVEGRGRCDLLPLDVLFKLTGRKEFEYINNFVRTGRIDELYKAITGFSESAYCNVLTAMLELSKHYESGAIKYAPRNWEKGLPLHTFIDSGVRHFLKYLRGDVDEPHDRAFLWNLVGAIWTTVHYPDLIDLPFSEMVKKSEDSY